MERVAVVGSGSWGTALAQILGSKGYRVSMWARRQDVADSITRERKNPRYLTDATLSGNITASTCLDDALKGVSAIVVATPSTQARVTAESIAVCLDEAADPLVVICSKGVEEGTGLKCDEVFAQVLGPKARIAVLSGPNHAEEVVKGILACSVVASADPDTAAQAQELFASDTFRTYASTDITGVELCAAFKNVIAIATGLSYGLGYGDNTASALMTRGMAEMGRLVVACGGNPLTCMGLAGTGDLIATCMSQHSRNRRLGQMIAAGHTLDDFTRETHMVAEGAFACKTLDTLAKRHGVELPITNLVRQMVWEGRDPKEAAAELFQRPLKDELYGLEQEVEE